MCGIVRPVLLCVLLCSRRVTFDCSCMVVDVCLQSLGFSDYTEGAKQHAEAAEPSKGSKGPKR
jgi:hypothetical protein